MWSKRSSTTRRWALPLAALVIAMAVPTITSGATRCVLGEYLNATW